ncbi:transcriptional regulator [Flindersiella endophytica]
MSIRVFLVDDQELVRAGFRMVVDSQPDMEVVGEAGNGGDALAKLAATAADVVLMDVRMPGMDGVQATKALRAKAGAPQVLVLTTFDLDEYVFSAVKAGASGFLLKDAPPGDLLAGIRAVHSGDAVVAPSATRRLLERFAPHLPDDSAPADTRVDTLTDREREVLLEVARGLSNAEIAARMFLSEATVKTHIGRILGKLGLRDRVQLVVFAYENALVRPGG